VLSLPPEEYLPTMIPRLARLRSSPLPLALLLGVLALPSAAAPVPPPRPQPAPLQDAARLVAVVNGAPITEADVDARCRLFALSTGLPMTQEVLDRLKPQIIRQLIDEQVQLQEIQRRQVIVHDSEIAAAIREIEQRNNMPPGTLQKRLAADGAGFRTLVDQVRVQIGWGRVLRQVLGDRVEVSEADVARQLALLKAQSGQLEYHISEIFVPATEPDQMAEAKRFADTIIQQLRNGAPFAVVAAEFSQSQTALHGGDEGWVQANEIDPAVLRVLQEMPVGAISNPIPVPGGLSIVTLGGKRVIGNDMQTVLSIRQLFLPFPSPLDPNAPTAAQQAVLEKAKQISTTAKSCPDIDAAAKAEKSARPDNPGEVILSNVAQPMLHQLLATLPVGQASQPLLTTDGVAVLMVCSREQRNLGLPSAQEMRARIMNQRAELASEQLLRELRRKAVIDRRF
jgi:peptidyl-prolyl cis-trans isomerase SurA